jgi:hypothetical protein
VSQHLETASKISGTFADTVTKILAEARTDTDRREARLIALLQDREV